MTCSCAWGIREAGSHEVRENMRYISLDMVQRDAERELIRRRNRERKGLEKRGFGDLFGK